MAELKTRPTAASVPAFLKSIADEARRKECRELVKLMKEATGQSPRMWGESIVGFGQHHLKYASGRELDWFMLGFSPRKQALTLYLMCGLANHRPLLEKLGKHKTGKGCLYVKSLDDVDRTVLKQLLQKSVDESKKLFKNSG